MSNVYLEFKVKSIKATQKHIVIAKIHQCQKRKDYLGLFVFTVNKMNEFVGTYESWSNQSCGLDFIRFNYENSKNVFLLYTILNFYKHFLQLRF